MASRVSNKVRPGEVCNHLTCSFVIRFCYIPHRQPPAHLAETSMLERFQFGPFCFSAQLSLPRTAKFTTTLIEPATDIDRYLCCRVIACSWAE
jgi:hypothetical protein